MLNASLNTFDLNDITAAFQLAIFVEDGLEIKNNSSARGGNAPAIQEGANWQWTNGL